MADFGTSYAELVVLELCHGRCLIAQVACTCAQDNHFPNHFPTIHIVVSQTVEKNIGKLFEFWFS